MTLLKTLSNYLPQNDIPELVLDFLEPEDVYENLEKCEYKDMLTRKYKVKYDYVISYITSFRNILHSFDDKPSLVSCFDDTPSSVSSFTGHRIMKWHRFGNLHREGDNPAIIFPDGECRWMINDRLHRDYYPAIIKANPQCLVFFKNGEIYYPDKNTVKKIKLSEKFKSDWQRVQQIRADPFAFERRVTDSSADSCRTIRFQATDSLGGLAVLVGHTH
jgi:hypothetical protein